jgi:hypothetical protein
MKLRISFGRFNMKAMRLVVRLETVNLRWWRYLKLKLRGATYWCRMKLKGHQERKPFYIHKCSKHGYFGDYVHGFPGKQYVNCPTCLN